MKTVDGRKAKVINWRETYPTYIGFAKNYGYPDEAYDPRVEIVDKKVLKNGEIVTLLVSGKHEREDVTLWVVETKNKVRHIIGEKGLKILGTNSNNTLTVDGITYLKVERNAKEGEKVLVIGVAPRSTKVGHVSIGEVLTVKEVSNTSGDISSVEEKDIVGILSRDWGNFGCEYVVLEPLQGELHNDCKGVKVIDLVDPNNTLNMKHGKIESCCSCDGEKMNQMPHQNGLAEYVASLETRITRLERLLLSQEEAEDDSSETVDKTLTRDEIIEKAKEDVAKLIRIGRDDHSRLPSGRFSGEWFDVEFVVNRKKQTVVALVYELNGLDFDKPYPRKYKYPSAKGVAKCYYNDVFNVHIGKVVALHRALELDIPVEYLNVPQPTEPQIGDVVDEKRHYYRKNRVVAELRPTGYTDADKGLTFVGGGWTYIDNCKVIDDSRDGRFGEIYIEKCN